MEKKVTFNLKIQRKSMYMWLYAHREARKANWLEISADRCRFRNRIEKMENVLSYIFDKAHREYMRKYIYDRE